MKILMKKTIYKSRKTVLDTKENRLELIYAQYLDFFI